jgi:hypothetical protein
MNAYGVKLGYLMEFGFDASNLFFFSFSESLFASGYYYGFKTGAAY